MNLQSVDQLLAALSFSGPLATQIREQLARFGRVSEFQAGQVIFREGDRGRDLYLISAGHVALEMQVPLRGQVRILSLGPGELVGWSPLISDQPLTATAVAVDAVQLIDFPAKALRDLCEENHEIGYHVLRQTAVALSKRLVTTRLQMLDLFAETTPQVIQSK